MFKWNQLHHSSVKTDSGFMYALFATTIVFGHHSVVFIVADSLCIVFFIGYIFLMKYCLRYELKALILVSLAVRVLLEIYSIFRMFEVFNHAKNNPSKEFIYLNEGFGIPVTLTIKITDLVILIGEILITIKCISNYGKGLREMINKQTSVGINEEMDAKCDTEESV